MRDSIHALSLIATVAAACSPATDPTFDSETGATTGTSDGDDTGRIWAGERPETLNSGEVVILHVDRHGNTTVVTESTDPASPFYPAPMGDIVHYSSAGEYQWSSAYTSRFTDGMMMSFHNEFKWLASDDAASVYLYGLMSMSRDCDTDEPGWRSDRGSKLMRYAATGASKDIGSPDPLPCSDSAPVYEGPAAIATGPDNEVVTFGTRPSESWMRSYDANGILRLDRTVAVSGIRKTAIASDGSVLALVLADQSSGWVERLSSEGDSIGRIAVLASTKDIVTSDEPGFYAAGPGGIDRFDLDGRRLWHAEQASSGSYGAIRDSTPSGILSWGRGDGTEVWASEHDHNGELIWMYEYKVPGIRPPSHVALDPWGCLLVVYDAGPLVIKYKLGPDTACE